MRQKFSLEAAGKVLGVSANAMRARAKKYPDIYQIERDNRGKIWVHLDPENLQGLKVTKAVSVGTTLDDLQASIEVLQYQADAMAMSSDLREKLADATGRADAAERARDQAETDRDRWRELAQKLAERPRFRLWPWR